MENLRINERIQQNLLSAANWLQFIAIIGAIGIAFLMLGGLSCLVMGTAGMAAAGIGGAPVFVIAILYLIIGALYIFPVVKSFSLVGNIKKSMKAFSQVALDNAADDFQSILKFIGIITITIIVLYVILFIGLIALGVSGALSNL